MTKRIVHVVDSLDRCGAVGQLALVAGGLPADAFDQHVVSLGGGPVADELRAAGVPVTIVPARWSTDPFALRELCRHLSHVRPDLVHTWRLEASLLGRLAACWAGVARWVDTRRNLPGYAQWLPRMVDRCLASRTDRYVVNTAAMREACVEYGLPAEKIAVIRCGVEPAESSGPTHADLLAELGLPDGDRLIGVVGPLVSHKRIKDLIWYFELIYVLHQDVRLLVIGDGPQRRQLERLTRLLGSEDRVLFLGERDDMPQLLAGLDMVWHGSDRAAQASAILEAMAAGRPVVATDTPAHREWITPDETGMLVPVGGRAEYGRATDLLLTDAALGERLGEAARRRVLADFTARQMVEQHSELYRAILG